MTSEVVKAGGFSGRRRIRTRIVLPSGTLPVDPPVDPPPPAPYTNTYQPSFLGCYGCTGAANIPLTRGPSEQIYMRFVPRKAGPVSVLHFKGKHDVPNGYSGGNGGVLQVRVMKWNPSTGLPDTSQILFSGTISDPMTNIGTDGTGEINASFSFPEVGVPYYLGFANIGSSPATNFVSINFGRTLSSLNNANRTNVLTVGDLTYHSLDPRAVVYANNPYGGNVWRFGLYGTGEGFDVIPTYMLKYSDNTWEGQPIYAGYSPPSNRLRMEYTCLRAITITRYGYCANAAGTTFTFRKNGTQVGSSLAVSQGFGIITLTNPISCVAGDKIQADVPTASFAAAAAMDATWTGFFGSALPYQGRTTSGTLVSDRRWGGVPLPVAGA